MLLTVPDGFRCYHYLALSVAKVTFKKYSAVKITGNGRRETRKRVASFLTRATSAAKLAHSRDYQGKVTDKEQPTEGYFRMRKFASKGCDD